MDIQPRVYPSWEIVELLATATTVEYVKMVFEEFSIDPNQYPLISYLLEYTTIIDQVYLLLLEYGIDMEKECMGHRLKFPLCFAVYFGKYNVAKMLILHGASTRIEDENGNTLLDYCVFINALFLYDVEFTHFLLDYGAPLLKCLTDRTHPTQTKRLCVEVLDYSTLVQRRLSASRKSLCALLWCCKRGLFPALRGIILELAKQALAQRGGEGCGPRGHKWFIEN